MSGPASALPLVKKTEYYGCQEYANDIRAARDDKARVGVLKSCTLELWNKSVRNIHMKQFKERSNKIGYFGIAAIVTGVAAFIFSAIFTTVAAPLGVVSLISTCGMLYNNYHFRKDQRDFKRQGALVAQYYLAHGPIEAMKRKWQLGRFDGNEGVDLLLQSNEKIKQELEEAMSAINNANDSRDESNIKKLAQLLAPQQAIFDKLKKAPVVGGKENLLTEIVLKWFQGDHQDPKVQLYAQMKDPAS
jgi:hypothetical protein